MIYSLHAISSSSLLKPSQALFAQLTSVRSIDFPRAPTGRNLSLTCFVPGQFFFGGGGRPLSYQQVLLPEFLG